MSRVRIAIAAALLAATPAGAAPPASAAEAKANAIDNRRLIIRGADLKPITVYQWERDGKLLHAWPDQKQAVPYDASKVDVTLYNFPTGQLRRIFFPAHTQTAWHTNESDILFYSLDVHQVEFVGGQVFDGYPGDVTLHPAGVRHHSETISAGTKAEFAFAPAGRSGVDMISLSGRAQQERPLAEWVEGDARRVAGEGAPTGASRFTAKSFVFPGYVLVEAHYPKGAAIGSYVNDKERLAYVVSGRLRVTTDGVTGEIGAGDMVRMVAGRSFARTALADSIVLEVDGAKAP